MTSLQLFFNIDYEDNLIYLLNGRYYDAITLTPYQFPEGSSTARLVKMTEWTPEQIQSIPSRPLYVLTHNKWIIFGVRSDGSLVVIAESGPIDNNETVVNATIFKLPDISRNNLSQEGLQLNSGKNLIETPRIDIPIEIFERFIFLVNNGMRLGDFNQAVPSVGVEPLALPQPIPGLPGGNIGLSDLTSSGGSIDPYVRRTPLSIRPSAEMATSPPGSPTSTIEYDGSSISRDLNSSVGPRQGYESPPPTRQGLPSIPGAPQKLYSSSLRSARVIPLRLGESDQNGSIGNPPVRVPLPPNTLVQQSYETLMKQLYSIPVQLPVSISVDGLPANFIDINQAGQLLATGQIEKYTINPLLQPWAGHPSLPNRIITLLNRNGASYLVKVKYDQKNGQIYPPV
jgi:hypothetical protein